MISATSRIATPSSPTAGRTRARGRLKREILFQGQQPLITTAVEAVQIAAPGSEPFQVLETAVIALCGVHTADRRETGRLLGSILASSSELLERAALADVVDRELQAYRSVLNDVSGPATRVPAPVGGPRAGGD